MKKLGHYLGNIAEAVLAFVLYAELEVLYFRPHQFDLGRSRVFVTALATVLVLYLISYIYRRQLRKENDWGFDQTPHWDMHRLGIAMIGFVLIIVGSIVMLNLVGGGVSANQQSLDRIAEHNASLFKILVVFIAPFCEEHIFRGMFFNIFFTQKSTSNKWLGIVASGFLFAYLHDPALSKYIFVYWVLGMVLAWVYMSTKDLRYSILVHMCYNALGFI
ncbi:type II CAAX endopeptidase family protein [uncultured Lactobacillus sp.]|uniref:type II CAAX endopeptidase family protein n=1 Tax=uncultured Lactobacillus sp. TaxID=153152 RepID=UPI00260DB3FC|nr:type II CAAX endopeptidase family protein [uncultured Lactobacillus sp.]